MHVYIPTLGRLDNQRTLKELPQRWLKKTKLVVAKHEAKAHKKEYGERRVMVAPVEGISATRQWIIENALSRYVMFLSDDLLFNVRYEGIRLRRAKPAEVGEMLDLLMRWLKKEKFAHVGVSPRGGNNHCEADYMEITRMNDAYAYDTEVLLKEGYRFDVVPLMQDFHMTLELLKGGYPNRVTYKYAWGQQGSNAKGGCSLYRTPELLDQTAKKLSTLHAPFVTVRAKKSKSSWKGMREVGGMTIRTDVVINWKQAYRPKKAKGKRKVFR